MTGLKGLKVWDCPFEGNKSEPCVLVNDLIRGLKSEIFKLQDNFSRIDRLIDNAKSLREMTEAKEEIGKIKGQEKILNDFISDLKEKQE